MVHVTLQSNKEGMMFVIKGVGSIGYVYRKMYLDTYLYKNNQFQVETGHKCEW